MSWNLGLHHVGLIFPSTFRAEVAMEDLHLLSSMEMHKGFCPTLAWQRVEAFSCQCVFLDDQPMLELIVPDEGTPLFRYLSKSVSCLHHIAFSVKNIQLLPFKPLFPKPALGANKLLVNFFPPQNGLLVEVVEVPR